VKVELPDFSNARVLVLGDVMIDRYWYGDTARISPEAPVPVVHVGQIEDRPGGAANVALNIAALEVGVSLLGCTGTEAQVDEMAALLRAAGVSSQFGRIETHPTIVKLRVMSRHQQLIRLDFEQPFSADDSTSLLPDFAQRLNDCQVVVLSDYGKGTLCDPQPFVNAARAAGKPVLIDPKRTDFGAYAGATVVTPNLSEFELAVGRCHSEKEIVERGRKLMAQHNLGGLLITRGERGMTLLQGEKVLTLPALAREVYDVTGAGDTVIATLAAAMAAGSDMADATALANLAAGLVVGKLGTASVTAPELQQLLLPGQDIDRGVVNEEQLLAAVAQARVGGERIVMTNGCFDILHAGHVTYLQQARERGDRLIVAVNDDASVTRLKGEGRPINSVDRRMALLAALECVDWVLPFSEETPERLICAVVPDLLVKGGDYSPEQVAGRDCVIAAGGRVEILAFVDGHSTTSMIDAIKNRG
jgi:D-beta-D-heptose 7-phosphate kinase/D-beta-D-heptose 1-phosphate adenosyltransferase